MAFFIGEYQYTIDNKGRVNIPAKFRKTMSPEAENTFIITQSKDKCLDAYPLDVFQQKIVDKINEFSESDEAHRYYTSVTGSNSVDAQLDKQGRIAISPKLLEHAGIKKEIMIIGAFHRIEFWEPEARKQYLEKMKNSEVQIDKELMP
ncbi:division/cell wall cluster transcriptional repressor MraZ [candidate division KSB1 bacterium]|nr:division/cell wall cluster transcriptional repressor MraZ [candidate division KSB1 bacterium]